MKRLSQSHPWSVSGSARPTGSGDKHHTTSRFIYAVEEEEALEQKLPPLNDLGRVASSSSSAEWDDLMWGGGVLRTAQDILPVALALANSLPGSPRSWLSSRHKLALEPQAASPARRLYIVVAPGRSCSGTCPVTPPPPGMPRDGENGHRGLSC